MAARWLRSVWLVVGLGFGLGLNGPAGAQVVDGAEAITLHVVGVGSFDDYAGLLNYLARVAAIKTANPIQVINDEVTLQLKIQGNAEQLVRQFASDNRLAPLAPVEGALSLPLQYRWSAPRG